MGRPGTVMQGYLSDKERFADLFNGIFFQGVQFIQSCDLQDSSERYSETAGQGTRRFRDIKQNNPRLHPVPLPWGSAMGRPPLPAGHDGLRR